MARELRKTGHGNVFNAMTKATRDLRELSAPSIDPLPEAVRIDGKTCLVTGANSGLGRAAAIELARRGGNMLLACRPGHTGVADEIGRLSGSDAVALIDVDLSDLRSVHRCCDDLQRRGVRIDIALMNAGVMSRRSQKTPQGYEVMFAVHFLANRVMIDRWLQDGVISPARVGGETPRVVFVASDSHRSAAAIDFDRFGSYAQHGMSESMRRYAESKLVLCTFAAELSRRLNPTGNVEVAVHALCPGGVATNIVKEAPRALRPIFNAWLRRFFQSPTEAIGPVVHLCCAPEAGNSTGMYLHMMHRKQVSPDAADPHNGARLWEASEPMVARSGESA
ncbi:MAG: SDR family NAD(P)-dependent oxidoreductase [Acidimicrobiia bacterium]|nr:SDR family NAD(P)-dependent oxidoreductase [Acidimicrobiia bacterium]